MGRVRGEGWKEHIDLAYLHTVYTYLICTAYAGIWHSCV